MLAKVGVVWVLIMRGGGVCVTGVWVQVLLVLTHTTPTLASMLLTYHTDT